MMNLLWKMNLKKNITRFLLELGTGFGFIGSHTVVELLDTNYEVVVIDNLSNSSVDVVDKIKEITGKEFVYYENDVCDLDKLEEIFSVEKPDAVMHFAGFKAVGESVREPIKYYENNNYFIIIMSACLLNREINMLIVTIIFSSSSPLI